VLPQRPGRASTKLIQVVDCWSPGQSPIKVEWLGSDLVIPALFAEAEQREAAPGTVV
jgi:hypothetical protein